MTEEKDDFLREIDELLQGDLDGEVEAHPPKTTEQVSLKNIENGVADLDFNSLDVTSAPAKQVDSNHVPESPQQKVSPPPKTG